MIQSTAVTLSTSKVTLQPLTIAHLADFYQAGNFAEIWRWSLPNPCQSLAAAKAWLLYSQEQAEKGRQIPFAIFDNNSKQLVGSTRFCSINQQDRSVEIGFTFVTPNYQQSYINTHAKYCLLAHAFEVLNVIRVEFKSHEKNEKSRCAIARLGAKYEGLLRNQRILVDGSFRNTAIFSIIQSEWPQVKQALINKMSQGYQ